MKLSGKFWSVRLVKPDAPDDAGVGLQVFAEWPSGLTEKQAKAALRKFQKLMQQVSWQVK